MLMAKVGTFHQDLLETTRKYASCYQKLRREAGLEDGTQLAVVFFISLRDNVRAHSQVAIIATHFGSILLTSINQVMDLVLVSGEGFGLALLSKRMRNNSVNKVANSDTTSKTNFSTYNNKFNKDKLCSHCNKVNWFPGHKCLEYKLKKFNKTSRTAR